jgi:DNA polymerase-2
VNSSKYGFLLSRNWRDTGSGVELEFWLSTDEGPRKLQVPAQQALFFLPVGQIEQARTLLDGHFQLSYRPLELQDFTMAPVAGLYFGSQRSLRQARDQLLEAGLEPLEADINPAERFLMERFVSGSMTWQGGAATLRVQPADYQPTLKMLSIDIETAMYEVDLYSIAAYGLHEGVVTERVFMVGEGATDSRVESCSSERALLSRFCQWLQEYDPDVLIGWNVVNFDLWFLQRLAKKLNTRLPLGREGRTPHWRELDDDGERRAVQIPGRVVLDGIETLRTATWRFESFSLENVSRELLGSGKLLTGSHRGEEIGELFRQDKDALAAYNLRDCELVWEIFEHTQLLEFAIARSRMTGLAMDRLGGSVAAFDHLYLPRLHREGFVAPNASKDQQGSPGGFVMDSRPGIYEHVLVLDFKSLYPSIIRSFAVDPMGLAVGLVESDPAQVLEGFQGGRFSRSRHILPAIIEQLWKKRDEAKAGGDAAQSQAIKIIMNSFYGVLGTPGCRFFDARLASSITRRGHQIIQQTRDRIEELGEQVIYGDTDSVFVWLQNVTTDEQAQSRGLELQQQLNEWWAARLRDEFKLDSVLELEFETHYQRFLMPTVRPALPDAHGARFRQGQ